MFLRQLVFPAAGWITFQPALAAENGWEDYPEAMPRSGYAFCRLSVTSASGWAQVEVED